MKKLALFLAILFAMPAVFAVDLSDYPSFFSDVSVVIGDNATSVDVYNANAIVNSLNEQGISNRILLASEIADITGMNIISVGYNAVSNLITNNALVITNGTARISLHENNGTVKIAAFGNTPEDTRKAAYVLANWKTLPLETSDIVVGGTVQNITLSKFIPVVDYYCGNQTYGYGTPWPQPCPGNYLLQYYPVIVPVTPPQNQTGSNQTNQTNQTGGNQTGGNQTVTPTPGAAFTIGTISTLGSGSQERGENVSTQFTLQNTGTVALTGFTFSGIDAKYKAAFTNVPSSLASGAFATVTMTAYVPLDLDSVDDDCSETAVSIGTLSVSTAQNTTVTQSVKMQAENKLSIISLFAKIASGQKKDIETGYANVYTGDDVDVIVGVKNRFGSDDDPEIDVEVSASGDTDELDLDNSDDVEIDSDSDDEATLSGTVDDDAKGNIRLILTAEGEDENGAMHCDQTVARFNVLTTTRTATQQNKTQPITFIPLEPVKPVQKNQTVQPAVQPATEPRQESVDTVAPVAEVKSTGFNSTKSYAILLGVLILVLLGVLITEIVVLSRKHKYIDQE
jgi:hypothetical protein